MTGVISSFVLTDVLTFTVVIATFINICKAVASSTSSTSIAEKPRCRVGQFWPKVEDDILQTV